MLRPSGAKSMLLSCSGVSVICLVVVYSVEVTNTSPWSINATSLPLGDTAISVAPEDFIW